MVRTDAVADGVLLVRLDRPARRNAIDSATATALHDAFLEFDADDSRRVAVLTGDDAAVERGRQVTFAAGFAEGVERFGAR